MKRVLVELFYFLKSGDINKNQQKNKLALFFNLFILDVILGFLIGLVIVLLFSNVLIQESTGVEQKISTFIFLLEVILIAPLVEELGFRLFLKYSPFNLALSLSVITYFVLSLIFNVKYYTLDTNGLFIIGFCLLSFFLLFILLKKKREFVKVFYEKKYKTILFLAIILFAYMHIFNYSINLKVILLSPILLFPYLFSSIIYSFARVKLGFVWCILLHIFANVLYNAHLIATIL